MFSLGSSCCWHMKKPFFCCLTLHLPVLTQVELSLFLFYPCRCELQLCNLPLKPGLTYRDYLFSFSALIPDGVPCSARVVSCPFCLTCDTRELPAPVLLKRWFSKNDKLSWTNKASGTDFQRTLLTRSLSSLKFSLLMSRIEFCWSFFSLHQKCWTQLFYDHCGQDSHLPSPLPQDLLYSQSANLVPSCLTQCSW